MDKFEYRIRAEEINALIERKEYVEAVKIADTIDWRRVRSVVMLCKVSELYKMNRRYEDSKEVLLLAYDLQPNSRKIVYSLCELSIKLEETVQAVEYYKEFTHIAPRDTGRFILQYRLYEAQDVSLEERIAVLEEYKKRDYREKWAYELAYLYHRIGLATRCVEECDELVLWFGEGRYVIKALELKMLHAPLTPEQQEKYNARFAPVEEMAAEVAENVQEEVAEEPSLPIEIKAIEPTRARTEEIPARKVNEEAEHPVVMPESTKEIPDIPYDVMTGYVQQKVTEGDMSEESVPEEMVSTEPVSEEALPEETALEEVPSEDMALEETASEESVSEELSEDEDMKIVNPAEDLDIQVKTIDVGDAYNTINLQEELAKNLAEILAQEDMEAVDATKALPVDSIFQAANIAASLEKTREAAPESTAAVEEVTEISAPEEEKSPAENAVDEVKAEEPEAIAEEEKAEEPEEAAEEEKAEEPEEAAKEEKAEEPEEAAEEEKAEEPEEAAEEEKAEEPEIIAEEIKPEEAVRLDTSDIVAAAEKIKAEIMAASLEEEEAEEPETAVEEEKAEEPEAAAEEEKAEEPEAALEEEKAEEPETAVEEEKAEEPEAALEEEKAEEPEVVAEEVRLEELLAAVKKAKAEEESKAEESVLEIKSDAPVKMDTSSIIEAAEKIKAEIMGTSLEEEKTEETGTEAVFEEVEKEEEKPEEPAAVTEEERSEEPEKPAEKEEELETETVAGEEKEEVIAVAEESIEDLETEELEEIEEIKAEKTAEIEPLFFGKNEPLPESFIQAVQNVAMEAAKEAAKQAAHATVEAMKEIQPEASVSDKEDLSQDDNKEEKPEAAVQEKEPEPQVEKQITGQLSFNDIMAEWEETKKANEEKHLQEMKQRVLEQTGPLFSDFDAATRANSESGLDMLSPMLDVFSDTEGLATEVENALVEEETPAAYEAAVEEPVIPPLEEAPTAYVELVTEPVTEPVAPSVEEAPAAYVELVTEPVTEPVAPAVEETPTTYHTLSEKLVSPVVEIPEPAEQTVKSETEIIEDRPSSFNTEEINGLEDKLMYALGNQHYETANIPVPIPVAKGEISPRALTKEEKEYFGSIAQTKDLQEKVAYALDSISLVPVTGNVIVTGEKGTGALEIAQNVAAYLSRSRSDFTGNSITYTGKELAETNVVSVINEAVNGALIIDNAGDLSANLCGKLIKAASELSGRGIVFIFVDTKSDIDRLTRAYQKITEHFDVRIDITTLDNNGLVNFGKEYAKEREYSIDDMGVLALYNRIEERQTSVHAVTVEEVKELVNEAIIKAEKKNLTHFMDVIFAKRYDKDDMVVLREKDFMNE